MVASRGVCLLDAAALYDDSAVIISRSEIE